VRKLLAILLLVGCNRSPVETAIADLKSGDPVRQKAAIQRCYEMREGATDAIPALVELLVQQRALREGARVALQNMGPQVLPAVKDLARHADPDVRYQTLALLANLLSKKAVGFEDVFPSLSGATKDDSPEVRGLAVTGLSLSFPDAERAVPFLVAGLGDPSPIVRVKSAAGLGTLASAARPALPGLVRALLDESPEVRSNAGRSLKFLATLEPDVSPLLALRRLTPEEARERLRQMGFSPAEGALRLAFSRDDVACVLLLLRAGETPDEPMLRIAGATGSDRPFGSMLAEAILEAAKAPR
jgi:HEAT repeat protein